MAYYAKVGSFNIDSAKLVGEYQSVSSLGFTPKIVLFWWSGTVDTVDGVRGETNNCGFGAAKSSTERWASSGISEDGVSPSNSYVYQSSTRCIKMFDNGSGSAGGVADFQSMDEDGFTLIIDTQFTKAIRVSYLALGGDDLTNIFVGGISIPAVSGEQDITGFGFQPDICMIGGYTSSIDNTGGVTRYFQLGMATGPSNQGVINTHAWDGAATTNTKGYGYDGEVIASRGLDMFWSFVSFISDGVRLNNLDNSPRFVYFVALKGGKYKVHNLNTRTDSNDIVEADVGFSPVALFFESANRALSTVDTGTNHARMSIGAATSPTNRVAQAISDENGLATTECATANYEDAVYLHVKDDTIEAKMDLKSMDSGGFTCVMDDTETSACWVNYLAIGASGTATSSSKSAYLKGQSGTSDSKHAYTRGQDTARSASFSSVGVLDDFNRGSLGSDWTITDGAPVISDNKLVATTGGALVDRCYYNKTPFGLPLEIYHTIGGLTTTSEASYMYWCRNTGTLTDFYSINAEAATNTGCTRIALYKKKDGAASATLAYTSALSWSDRTSIRLGVRFKANGDYSVYLDRGSDWELVLSGNDPDPILETTYYSFLSFYRGSGVPHLTYDDFGCGSIPEDLVPENAHAYLRGQADDSSSKHAYLEGATAYGFEIEWAVLTYPAPSAPTATGNKPAYLAGQATALSNKPAFLKGSIDVQELAHAYLHGSANDQSSKSAYLHGQSSVVTSKSAYTKGRADGVSSKPAYLHGQTSFVGSKLAYTKGQADAIQSKPAYLKGLATDQSSKHAYVCGGIADSKHAYLEGIATTGASSKPAYTKGRADTLASKSAYTAGGLQVSSNKPAYLRGQQGTSSSKPAYLLGNASTSGSKPAYLLGAYAFEIEWVVVAIPETQVVPGTSSKHAYTRGSDSGVSSKHAYLCGGIGVQSSKSAYLKGQTSAVGNKSAYLKGSANILASAWAFTKGAIQTVDSAPAYLHGRAGITDSKHAYTEGFWEGEAVSAKSAYIRGRADEVSFKHAFSAGGETVTSSESAYLRGSAPATDSKHAYAEGYWEGEVVSSKAAFTKGRADVLSAKSAYLAGGLLTSASKSAYLKGQLSVVSSKHAYLCGGISSSRPAYLAGISPAGTDWKHAYTHGISSHCGSKHAYLAGGGLVADSKHAYLKGQANAVVAKSAYAKGSATGITSKSAYTKGKAEAIQSKQAFTQGWAHPLSSRSAYLKGQSSNLSSKPAYLFGAYAAQDTKHAYLMGLGYDLTLEGTFIVQHNLEGMAEIEYELEGTFETEVGLQGKHRVEHELEGEFSDEYDLNGLTLS